jgi:exonuclease SbcD
MALRILHVGDLHLGIESYGRPIPGLGFGTRVADYLSCLDAALERAADVDLVLFAGDVYKSCVPSPTVQREFAHRALRAARAAPVVIIPGNHDVPNSAGRANSVDIFAALEVERVQVLRQPQVIRVDTRSGPAIVAALPFVSRALMLAREEAVGKTISEVLEWMRDRVTGWIENVLVPGVDGLRQELGPDTPAILLGHYAAAGAEFGGYRGQTYGAEIQIAPSVLGHPVFDYVALGHIHRHQRVGLPGDQPPIVYAGSIDRIDFSEEREEKCVVYAEVGRGTARWEPLPLPTRKFLTVRVKADPEDPVASVMRAVERQRAAIEGAVVRVIYTLDRGIPAVPEGDLRQALQQAHYVAGIRREFPDAGVRGRDQGLTTQLDPLEALERYVRSQDDLRDRLDALLDCARPLLAEVRGAALGSPPA